MNRTAKQDTHSMNKPWIIHLKYIYSDTKDKDISNKNQK